jgi:hypothetical protein
MPHVQPRSEPKASPADIDPLFDAIAQIPPSGNRQEAGVNLLGVTGSDMEFDGEIGFMVEDEADVQAVYDAIKPPLTYSARLVGEPDGLHLDYVDDQPGGLRQTLTRARAHHPRGVVRDIAVGVRKIGFTLNNGEVTRDGAGNPVPGTTMCLPVQIFFIEPKVR